MLEELLEQIREKSRELVSEAGFRRPPVNPYSIAARCGIRVEEKPLETGEGGYSRRSRSSGGWVVVINSEDIPERRSFSVAHEVMEIIFAVPEEYKEYSEALYDIGASEILMPSDWFEKALKELGWDLRKLKERFGASYEATARKMVQLGVREAVLTIVDNQVVTGRLGSKGLRFPGDLWEIEKRALEKCYEVWEYQRLKDSSSGLEAECYPIEERRGIKRVIMFSYPG